MVVEAMNDLQHSWDVELIGFDNGMDAHSEA